MGTNNMQQSLLSQHSVSAAPSVGIYRLVILYFSLPCIRVSRGWIDTISGITKVDPRQALLRKVRLPVLFGILKLTISV